LVEYCILPLAIEKEDDGRVFPKISSILLYGPAGSGKNLLVKSIATELGAQIFNLSPRNTAGQFIGKANVTKMLHMVFKVARAQAPSVIYLENIDMVFAKKVPKDDTSDPKRIKKDLIKSLKLISSASEKVVFIGTSNKPWNGDAKAMMGIFDKIIRIPTPDYSSRLCLWKGMIKKRSENQDSLLNYSLLARSSAGLTAGGIEAICDKIASETRREILKNKPLRTDEFLGEISSLPKDTEEAALFEVLQVKSGFCY
jgi:SpoVK/Ycf46/Vps4 family AAA+-type ATPase